MANELITGTLADIDRMEASGDRVFFRFSTVEGKTGKTDIMSPAEARDFLDVADIMGVAFSRLFMGRAEHA